MLTFFRHLNIMLMALKNRILKSLLEILVLLDITIGLIIAIPFYILLGHPVPNAYETISSVVGKYSMQRYKWAMAAEWVIDRLFYPIEGRLGHCKRHIRWYGSEVQEDDIDWENIPN